MSLPWRYSSAEDYVQGMVGRLQSKEDVVRHLKIGKFYLHGQASLETEQVASILQAAQGHARLEEITLCDVHMSGTSLSAFVDLLRSTTEQRTSWKKLIFNACDRQAVLALTTPSLLDHYIPIDTISITRCDLQCQGFESLGRLLASNLKKLEITEETVDNACAVALAEGLRSTRSLKLLEMSYCTFQEQAVESLATGFQENKTLESLFLPGCELEDDQLAIIVTSLQDHPTLTHVALFRNHFSTEGTKALASLQRSSCSKITKLDLSYQQFERAKKLDISMVAESLATSTTLRSLSLSFNKLNNDDIQKLTAGLACNQTLQEIDLRANNVRDDGVCDLATNVLRKHPSLRKVYLFGNPFGSKGADALLGAIRENTKLMVLNMDYNSSSYESVQFYCCLNRGGRRLLKAPEQEQGVPPGLWPLVLDRAKSVSQSSRGICSTADIIYHLLQGPAVLEGRGEESA
jgi:Ran GTPase-activating protein (RanGAP) involved in mRNA processing and transport